MVITDNGSNIKCCMKMLQQEQNSEILDDQEDVNWAELLENDDGTLVSETQDLQEGLMPSGFHTRDVQKRIEQLEKYYHDVNDGMRPFDVTHLSCICHSLQLGKISIKSIFQRFKVFLIFFQLLLWNNLIYLI